PSQRAAPSRLSWDSGKMKPGARTEPFAPRPGDCGIPLDPLRVSTTQRTGRRERLQRQLSIAHQACTELYGSKCEWKRGRNGLDETTPLFEPKRARTGPPNAAPLDSQWPSHGRGRPRPDSFRRLRYVVSPSPGRWGGDG